MKRSIRNARGAVDHLALRPEPGRTDRQTRPPKCGADSGCQQARLAAMQIRLSPK